MKIYLSATNDGNWKMITGKGTSLHKHMFHFAHQLGESPDWSTTMVSMQQTILLIHCRIFSISFVCIYKRARETHSSHVSLKNKRLYLFLNVLIITYINYNLLKVIITGEKTNTYPLLKHFLSLLFFSRGSSELSKGRIKARVTVRESS